MPRSRKDIRLSTTFKYANSSGLGSMRGPLTCHAYVIEKCEIVHCFINDDDVVYVGWMHIVIMLQWLMYVALSGIATCN